MKEIVNKMMGPTAKHPATILFAALLVVLGWLLASRNYTAFIHPRFWPFLLVGAVIVFGFIVVLVLRAKPPDSGGHFLEMAVRSLIMATPLLFMATVYGQGMGAHALTKKYTGSEQRALSLLLEQKGPEFKKDRFNREFTLLDIARNMNTLQGKRVVTEGLVYRDHNVPPNYLLLFRFGIFCCAADAIPVWVLVEKDDLTSLEVETWIQVDGTLQISHLGGKDVPVIYAEKILRKSLPPPGARYLYF